MMYVISVHPDEDNKYEKPIETVVALGPVGLERESNRLLQKYKDKEVYSKVLTHELSKARKAEGLHY